MTREKLEHQLNKIKESLRSDGAGRSILRATTALMEQVIDDAFIEALRKQPQRNRGVAILATGGFGRRELHPHSDIDIITLFEMPLQPVDEEFLKSFLHPLWDLGLSIGHHILQLNHYDFDARNLELATALLDVRLLAGDSHIFSNFSSKELPRVLSRRKKDLLKALVSAHQDRHKRFNDTIYQLEPDVKEAPGGLRDFQVARWIGRISYGIESSQGFVNENILGAKELARILKAQQFLLVLRSYLHLLTGRNRNILSHDLQGEIACRMGYKNGDENLRVEVLMKDYFLRAKEIHSFCESMIRRAFPPARKIGRSFKSTVWSTTVVRRGALCFPVETILKDNPANMLKLFYRSAKYNIPISEGALDQVKKHLKLINEEIRSSHEVRNLFFKLLRLQKGVFQVLTLMHEIGLLGQIFPEFNRIRCHVIQDFFHKYTVDEHSLLTIKNLEDLYHSRKPRDRRFGEMLRSLSRPDLVLFSMLFHDVGKADTGNHCEKSILAVNRISQRINLPQEEAEKIRFLIQNHLEMSNAFQRRDITDDAMVKRFTEFIGNQENLRMLCLVTYADIKAVSPEALTPWKEDVLWQLYVETEAQLTRAFADERWDTHGDATLVKDVSQVLGIHDASAIASLQSFLEGFPRRYLRFTPKERIAEHFKLAEKVRSPGDMNYKLTRYRSTYELSLMAFDRPYLFAKLSGVLSYFGMNILRGQAFANRRGIILDIIQFEDRLQSFRLNKSEVEKFRLTLQKVLTDEESLTELLRKRESSILFQRKTRGSISTFINFDDQSSEKYTIMEIVTRDRFGLLYSIAKTIAQSDCNIDVALISTEGHRAIDVFYLTLGGKKLALKAQKDLAALMKETLDQAAA